MLGTAPFHRSQLTSVTTVGAADLPGISRREPAAQRVERAIATRAALLISLSATGRWVLTIACHKKSSQCTGLQRGCFFLTPSHQNRFVVMATTRRGCSDQHTRAPFCEGAMRRTRGCLGNTPFLCASGHKNEGDVENRQPNQEHRRQQGSFREKLGNHKTHPKKHRGDHDGGEIRSHRQMLTYSPTGCLDLPWTVTCLHPVAQQQLQGAGAGAERGFGLLGAGDARAGEGAAAFTMSSWRQVLFCSRRSVNSTQALGVAGAAA